MKHWYTNGIIEKQFNETDAIPVGFIPGRNVSDTLLGHAVSEETKKKISEAAKGRTAHNKGKKETQRHIYYTNGEISIRIPETEAPPEGFIRGRLKRKLTNEEKDSFNEKRKSTCLELYSDSNYNNPEGSKASKLAHYGDANFNNREKAKETCIEKYGVTNSAKSEEVKAKIQDTCLSKYGVSHFSKSDLWKDKVSEKWASKSEEELATILDKRRETCIEKYGYTSSSAAPEVINKCKDTCMQRYGVSFFCMSPDCRSASSNNSAPNREFASLLESAHISYEREFAIYRKSYDFKIGNVLVEINPAATHNSTWSPFPNCSISNTYHAEKSNIAKEHNYRCIHVWDWDDVSKIVNLLLPRQKVYARQCSVKEIPIKEANKFLVEYHLQNAVKSDVQIGLYFDDKLVSVMTFGKSRYNKKYQYELLRYASSYNVTGGANKLFAYFVRTYSPESIISYCDYSKFSGNTYEKLGFAYKSVSIGKHWYNIRYGKHITDNLLRQRGFDQLFNTSYGKGTSNSELMLENGFVEIYDAGQATYVWNKDNS